MATSASSPSSRALDFAVSYQRGEAKGVICAYSPNHGRHLLLEISDPTPHGVMKVIVEATPKGLF